MNNHVNERTALALLDEEWALRNARYNLLSQARQELVGVGVRLPKRYPWSRLPQSETRPAFIRSVNMSGGHLTCALDIPRLDGRGTLVGDVRDSYVRFGHCQGVVENEGHTPRWLYDWRQDPRDDYPERWSLYHPNDGIIGYVCHVCRRNGRWWGNWESGRTKEHLTPQAAKDEVSKHFYRLWREGKIG